MVPTRVSQTCVEARRTGQTNLKGNTMKHTLAHFAATVAFIILPFTAFAADAIDEIPAAPEAPLEQAVAPSTNQFHC